MIRHYLTVAFRNLRKYGSQTLISVAGLAIGFTCFALASLWIRYEMTYDSFHRDAERIYCVFIPSSFSSSGVTRTTNYPLANYLETTFPEIAEAAPVAPPWPGSYLEFDGVQYPAEMVHADSAFFRFFDLRIIEGSMDFQLPESRKLAITQRKARELFGDENPIGKAAKAFGREYTICAVVDGLPEHSNYRFDVLEGFGSYAYNSENNWQVSGGEQTLIRLAPGVDAKAFGEKLYDYDISRGGRELKHLTLVPLTDVRHVDTDIRREVQFQHILIFALAGTLVILCTLFNYLTLFVNRFRIRRKEFALRVVCGASERSLFTLLSVEFVMSLLGALALGAVLVEMLYRPFCRLSEIRMELSAIYGEALLYTGAVMAFSLLVFRLVLSVFRRRTLNASIRRSRRNYSRKVSIVVQLLISIGFAFCTVVILKQMYHLHHTDLGFTFRDRGSVSFYMMPDGADYGVLEKQVGEIPEIAETLQATSPFVPQNIRWAMSASQWDGKPDGTEAMTIEIFRISERFASYYELRLLEGEMLLDSDPDSLVLISETALKAFGWTEPVGKQFTGTSGKDTYTVKGVIRNVYNAAPTVTPNPTMYSTKKDRIYDVLFRFEPGTWNTCRKKIEQLIQDEYPGALNIQILRTEEEYDKFLKSEQALLQILSFVTLVCVLICVFGFVSLVSLTCEERRKEMAIRKINGATVRDILNIFTREYGLLLLAGAALAFPCGYILMRRWLEQYVSQTGLDAWIYVSILSLLALAVVLCVGWRVYRTSIENPIDSIKSE